jgi:hypothetical protein
VASANASGVAAGAGDRRVLPVGPRQRAVPQGGTRWSPQNLRGLRLRLPRPGRPPDSRSRALSPSRGTSGGSRGPDCCRLRHVRRDRAASVGSAARRAPPRPQLRPQSPNATRREATTRTLSTNSVRHSDVLLTSPIGAAQGRGLPPRARMEPFSFVRPTRWRLGLVTQGVTSFSLRSGQQSFSGTAAPTGLPPVGEAGSVDES